jgi:hypothetical protein
MSSLQKCIKNEKVSLVLHYLHLTKTRTKPTEKRLCLLAGKEFYVGPDQPITALPLV